ncbi:MAG: 2-amino-4-hydroxy-6-hydroxymethyldihydropteridine diphosphokinase [Halofilum sp. (in: g-proteobacteria)]|nr:2-amino-4-hydroxy-6-hydroxymethyldihydropteridine diphosphokinase [Halofilum sp. (in: g-proteobacteria)]
MERVFLSVGSNVERDSNIPAGLRALCERFGPLAVSTLYECPAVGFDGEDFYNLVVGFDSEEPVLDVHEALHRIEDRFGRDRGQPKFSPRTLDIDLLLYGERILREGRLVLPRPEIERVAFVLAPLAELAPAREHPVSGVSFTTMWAEFDGIGARALQPVNPDGLVPPEVLA